MIVNIVYELKASFAFSLGRLWRQLPKGDFALDILSPFIFFLIDNSLF